MFVASNAIHLYFSSRGVPGQYPLLNNVAKAPPHPSCTSTSIWNLLTRLCIDTVLLLHTTPQTPLFFSLLSRPIYSVNETAVQSHSSPVEPPNNTGRGTITLAHRKTTTRALVHRRDIPYPTHGTPATAKHQSCFTYALLHEPRLSFHGTAAGVPKPTLNISVYPSAPRERLYSSRGRQHLLELPEP